MLLWTLSRLQHELDITIELMPLAPYHAYSLADAHGGKFKGAMLSEACRDRELQAENIAATIEAACNNTTAC